MIRKEQYRDSALFFFIAIVALIITLMLLVIKSHAQEPQQTGFLIVTQTIQPRKIIIQKVTNCAAADSIIAGYIGNNAAAFSTGEALKNTPFYRYERIDFSIYVEKKRVVHTRRGKLKFKKLRK